MYGYTLPRKRKMIPKPHFPACRSANVGYNGDMKITHAIVALLCAWAMPSLQAGEKNMQQDLAHWNQQLAEYQAAVSLAATEEQRADITPPSAEEYAPILWRTIRARTGERLETPRASKPGKEPAKARKIATYEFDNAWAAPAVIWFINHPDAFAKLFENDPKNLSLFAEALLDSVQRVHYAHPQVGEVCHKLAESTSAKVFEIIEKIYNHNENPTARSCAALALSCMLAAPTLSAAEGGDARARSKRLYYIQQALRLAPEDARFGSVSLTEAAQEEIYRLQKLTPGKVPPQVTVATPEGKSATFPVAGKVNLLLFWSADEDVGLSIMSKQVALMTRYPELILCPIVPHEDTASWLSMLQQQHITTCYMDNAEGAAGLAYRVRRLPLAVLINENARIIYIGYPNLQLQTELDNLFSKKPAKAPAPQAPPAPPAPAPQGDTPPELRPMPQF